MLWLESPHGELRMTTRNNERDGWCADLGKEGISRKSGGSSTEGVASVAILPVLQVLCRQDCGLVKPAELAPEGFPDLLGALHTCSSEHPESGTPECSCIAYRVPCSEHKRYATWHGPRIMRMHGSASSKEATRSSLLYTPFLLPTHIMEIQLKAKRGAACL